MLTLTMNWKDDNTNVVIQQKEEEFTEDTALCYVDAAEPASTVAADTFVKILTAAGYSQQTVARYMIDAGLSLMYNNMDIVGFNRYINQLYEDWGISE